ncbi:phosphoadenosine phosphosulfate reductase [Pseudorhodobacter sp.]|uniref:phosphoadenosine phosphosulfate reductase n=1 Tax=Pseudorhodobacter sp. TaxID=1934400 RepID=UPI0026493B81|nr:phosphoadenosine phosphosulfate reductase [Pseudorhodobacter sp.]MDN5786423.1 phosphoadenosine phosphosulfate reductase [Pseudorhodobacter sp.]
MSGTDLKTDLSAANPLDRDGWLALLHRMGDASGAFEALGTDHWAVFNDDGPILVVSFDRLEDISAMEPGKMPSVFEQATQNGWSHLSLISEGESWYRDASVYAYLDRLVDECFFDRFDRVVFYGAGMGAYAAAAFSVAAPGCTVLALRPIASLSPAIAGWDRRHLAQRRLNFTDRYGYAPDMTEGAAEVFLIYDPYFAPDAMHAALFRKPYLTALKTRLLGEDVATSLAKMGVLPKLIKAACEGTLTPRYFNRLWRERRNFGVYLRRILVTCNAAKRPKREAKICRSVTSRMPAPGFRNHLSKLESSGALK